MAFYRIYCMDGANRFTRAESFEARDDGEALHLAKTIAPDAIKYEVWEGSRLVAKIETDTVG